MDHFLYAILLTISLVMFSCLTVGYLIGKYFVDMGDENEAKEKQLFKNFFLFTYYTLNMWRLRSYVVTHYRTNGEVKETKIFSLRHSHEAIIDFRKFYNSDDAVISVTNGKKVLS